MFQPSQLYFNSLKCLETVWRKIQDVEGLRLVDHSTMILGLVWLLLITTSCRQEISEPVHDDTPYHYELPAGFPTPVASAENPQTQAKVDLGRRLFYDPILSADQTISCNSCHRQELAFTDDQAVTPGVEGRLGFRNAPTLANVAYASRVHKDGGVPKLDMQAGTPIEDKFEMDLSIFVAAERLNADAEYRDAFLRAFGREANAFTITRALAAFQRTLISGNSPYDQYTYQNQASALSEAETRGMELFFSDELACNSCHEGFNFTNQAFTNNGTKLDYSSDPGRYRVTLDSLDIGKFRVPTLRNVALTAPYMHDGSFPDLERVIAHYNEGGLGHVQQDERIRPLGLSPQQQSDLKAFLESLTDESFITNPAFGPS